MAATILLIEDQPDNKQLIVCLLESSGHRVRTASTGEAGVKLARDEMFDLIICDIHLPGIDGYEVARRLKSDSQWHQVPLVAVTALAMVGDRDKVLGNGFDGYLSKPISPRTFVHQIESFLPVAAMQVATKVGAVESAPDQAHPP